MKRRTFLKITSAFGSVATAQRTAWSGISFRPQGMLKYVFRGGNCFYQDAWQVRDIGIDENGKIKIAASDTLEAREVINIQNKIIAPGFIDILADNAANPEKTFGIFEKYKVGDGVTTALQMHGGTSDSASYYRKFNGLPHIINFGISTSVMRIRYATTNFADRKRRVEACLEAGALGVSHSLEYMPTPFDETLVYAKIAKKYSRPFFLHLRYSSRENELEGVDEAVRIARESGAHVHIDHLHSTGGTYHMKGALDKIREANAQGLSMTCCVYPYSFWATYLHSKRFDEGWQQRYGLTYSDLRLVGTGERLTASSFARYRGEKKLVAVPEGTLPLETTVEFALKESFCMIGSDGGIEHEPNANSHPRGAGCFATAIRHGLAIGMPMEKILEKVTILPRSIILPAMKDRGLLIDGAWADLTIFDPTRINGRATVANPNQFSDGIEMVFVNGKPSYASGKPERGNGVGIRY